EEKDAQQADRQDAARRRAVDEIGKQEPAGGQQGDLLPNQDELDRERCDQGESRDMVQESKQGRQVNSMFLDPLPRDGEEGVEAVAAVLREELRPVFQPAFVERVSIAGVKALHRLPKLHAL